MGVKRGKKKKKRGEDRAFRPTGTVFHIVHTPKQKGSVDMGRGGNQGGLGMGTQLGLKKFGELKGGAVAEGRISRKVRKTRNSLKR